MPTSDEIFAAEVAVQEDPHGQPVTPLELFFDLVLVFGITQVTGYVGHDPTWTRLIEGLAILAALWWAWVGYAWFANSTGSDEGIVRVVLLTAMSSLFIASLAVPSAFGRDALIFGIAYAIVRLLHIAGYLAVARNDPRLMTVAANLASTIVPAVALYVAAGAFHGTARTICWALALTVDYGGLWVRGVDGWRVEPEHFAERHGLIVIIALGESIVALGVGAQGLPLDAELIASALLGIAIAGALWWAYFDVAAIVAERRFKALDEVSRARMARDSYTLMHLPMVTGIIVFAIGAKRTLAHVEGNLSSVEAFALCGGVAMYLFALSAFKRRNVGSWNGRRMIVALVLLALWPVATQVPALVALAAVALLACGLIAVEAIGLADARDRVRHGEHDLTP